MVSQALFTVETPAIGDTTDGQTLQLGSIIKPDLDGWIVAIRWYFPTILPGSPVKAALFRESDNQRVSGADVTFVSPVAGTWNQVALTVPVAVSANQLMVPVVRTPDHYVASVGGASPWVAPLVNGHLSTAAGAGRFSVSDPDGSVQYPSSQANNGCYFVDYVWTDTLDEEPEDHETSGTAAATASATATRTTGRATAGTAAALSAARQAVSSSRLTVGAARATMAAAASRTTARTTVGVARAVAAARTYTPLVGPGPLLLTRSRAEYLSSSSRKGLPRMVTSTTIAK